MTSVVGLVLVAMTGLTITNHQRQQRAFSQEAASPSSPEAVHPDKLLLLHPERAKELERALAQEDEALIASYEQYQQRKHPRNLRRAMTMATGQKEATDPLPMQMKNSVYSLNTKSELTAGIDGAEFVVRGVHDTAKTSRGAVPRATTTTSWGAGVETVETKAMGGGDGAIESTTDGQQQQEEERPFDMYDPSLTTVQKREYVKKVDYFSLYLLFSTLN